MPEYFEATKYKNGSIPKTGGVGEFIKGNQIFNNYVMLIGSSDNEQPKKSWKNKKELQIKEKRAIIVGEADAAISCLRKKGQEKQ